ncbi:hypothetical protein [Azohydromonas aeria]|uniref:hypothetical protein n=1 Tax=Azohydromonas aeria TaxID=2590212 RepID=UPI0012FAECD8|nr:hypothetical protein [Azohydromonas aeria]
MIEMAGKAVAKAGAKRAAKAAPLAPLLDGLKEMNKARSDYKKLREQERTKRLAILADRDVSIERLKGQRDVIKQALTETFELRKTGLAAQIRAMDRALDSGNVAALHLVLDAMVKTIQTSPFKDIGEMQQQLRNKDFVLRLE